MNAQSLRNHCGLAAHHCEQSAMVHHASFLPLLKSMISMSRLPLDKLCKIKTNVMCGLARLTVPSRSRSVPRSQIYSSASRIRDRPTRTLKYKIPSRIPSKSRTM